MKKHIAVIHGPNLDRLGTREPEIYGHTTLDDLNNELRKHAKAAKVTLETFQSNFEGNIIETVHQLCDESFDGLIINPAALTHTSIALRDALLATGLPFIEVHISNVFARESFRHCSYLSDIAIGVISGMGIYGYHLALDAFIQHLRN